MLTYRSLFFRCFYGKRGLSFGNFRNIVYSGGIGAKGQEGSKIHRDPLYCV
jgi:hypothetical protein